MGLKFDVKIPHQKIIRGNDFSFLGIAEKKMKIRQIFYCVNHSTYEFVRKNGSIKILTIPIYWIALIYYYLINLFLNNIIIIS